VVEVELEWGPKWGGTARERYWLENGVHLHVESTVFVRGQSETTLQARACHIVFCTHSFARC
jgi:predicted nucleotidyltransferase